MKKCIHCNRTKPLSSFYAHKKMADGHMNSCKTCQKKRVSANRKKRIEQYQQYEQERNQRPERKKAALEYQRARRKRKPGKYKARCKVNNAIRDGRLKKMPCEVCGSENVQAHHTDYRKPLEVQWLCFKHHREAHGQNVI